MLTVCSGVFIVGFQLDSSTIGRCDFLGRGYDILFCTGFAFTKRFIVDGFWLESSPHKKISEAF